MLIVREVVTLRSQAFSGFEFFSALKQSPRAPQRHAPRRKPLSGLDSPELHKQNK